MLEHHGEAYIEEYQR